MEGRFFTLDATRTPVSRSKNQRSRLEAGGGIPCRPNPAATLFTYNDHTMPAFYLVSIHQTALPLTGNGVHSGRFTHTSGHPSAAGRAQDRESSPVRDRRSTTVPRNQGIMRMTHLPEIGAENQYRFLTCLPCNSVPNFSGNEQDVLYFRTGLSYQFSGADFWYVCHGHKSSKSSVRERPGPVQFY